MINSEIADILKLTANLLELLDDNPFKIKSLLNASFKIDKLAIDLADLNQSELEKVEGIGKSIAAKIHELNQKGTTAELQDLLHKVPRGVIEMMAIKGIGPKKVAMLWKNLAIESPGELLYACNENRLVELKGFGEKTQAAIKKSIEFNLANQGKFLFAEIEEEANHIILLLKQNFPDELFSFTGHFRMKNEIIERLELLSTKNDINFLTLGINPSIAIEIITINTLNFAAELFRRSASSNFLNAFNAKYHVPDQGDSEEAIFELNKLPYIMPSLRESEQAIQMAERGTLNQIIELNNITGIFHVHTKYSDGANSLKDMAKAVQEKGMQYIGITDHSRSAFYANGLSAERVLEQHNEINELNNTMAPFRIFKGIESDILNDGSLDYEEDILKEFDFVIASVHSVLKMDIDRATARLIRAIENPYTTMLGHMTGRLLLSREGYPLHTTKIIDACAANHVIIELNANPYRLDIDWRNIAYCTEKGVQISINPDAHSIVGLDDVKYGIYAAQKGLLTNEMCFNAKPLDKIISFLKSKQPS
jgi:DNA polymerase (family 10)